MLPNDRFTVVMPAFNAEHFITDALASVARTDGLDGLDRVIVVDDASQDATVDVARQAIASLGLPGEVVTSPANTGPGAARMRGCAMAESPVVACVDADDICRPARFTDPLNVLAQSPDVRLVGGNLVMFRDSRFPPIMQREFSGDGVIRQQTDGDSIAAALLFSCPIYAGAMTMRRHVLDSVSMSTSRIGEDWLFAHHVAQAFGPKALAGTGTILTCYRRHASAPRSRRAAARNNNPSIRRWRGFLIVG